MTVFVLIKLAGYNYLGMKRKEALTRSDNFFTSNGKVVK